ncbi:MAG: glycosyltransferase family 9 protein [Lysobacteraceae bacterium]
MKGHGDFFSLKWLDSRALRTRWIRWLAHRVFRSVDSALVGPGQLRVADVHRIVVLRPNHRLGNLLLITPLITELERTFPGAEVDIVVGCPAAQELLGKFFSVRRIHGLPRYMIRHPLFMLGTLFRIRSARYDLGIDTSMGSNSGRLLLAWTRPRYALGVPNVATGADARWNAIMRSAPRHMAQLPVYVLRSAISTMGSVGEAHYAPLSASLAPDERQAGKSILSALTHVHDSAKNTVIVGLFANATGNKRYNETWWQQFLATLESSHPEYVIVEIMAAHGRSQLGSRIPSFFSSSPRKMAAVMSNLTCFVSADCGVMHLACASDAPTIGLFSVTDASVYAPYGHRSQAVLTADKSPEQVAEAAIRIIEQVVSMGRVDIAQNDGPMPLDGQPLPVH